MRDPDGQPLTYEWDLDEDSEYDDGTGQTVMFDRVSEDRAFQVAVVVAVDPGRRSTGCG